MADFNTHIAIYVLVCVYIKAWGKEEREEMQRGETSVAMDTADVQVFKTERIFLSRSLLRAL